MNRFLKLLACLLSIVFGLNAQTNKTAFNKPPDWSKSAIWYQVFVERFSNGDPSNDPKPENVNVPALKEFVPKDWTTTTWTSNWYKKDAWAENAGLSIDADLQARKYGGDLQGLINKLDYLQDLGVNALFINPLNDAPSMHKYDARNYHHIDVNFGPDPVGDKQIIASENPTDPATWKWTAADKLFLKLVQDVHKRGMKIIIDYSWNHTGTSFWAWQDILKNQEKSLYKDWYDIQSFDDTATVENEFSYKGWLGIKSLPELKKVNITTDRVVGHPYEGDINEAAKAHIFAVTKRWLAPDGDNTKGIDGYRLDVADQIGMGFWRDFRKQVRSVQPNAYLIGEIWWEQWPDKMMNPAPYTQGDIFDAVMYYQAYRPARYFFAKNDYGTDARVFKDSLMLQWNRVPPANRYAMMNVSSSHDAPRLLTDFNNPNKYKFQANPKENIGYRTDRPGQETYKRVRLYLVHLFTTVGAPQIYNGEEMGMWGADDPFNRKPMMWKGMKFDPETTNPFQAGEKWYDTVTFNEEQFEWYKKLIKIRKDNPVLVNGDIHFEITDGKKLVYKRFDALNEIKVIFNLETDTRQFIINDHYNYLDLLTGKTIQSTNILLPSLSAVILKRIK
ncbi:MAG: glycoside hydrolase family 13 protein [Chitinophagaceae bacterium]|nr:glycoside hydrolase family 13 protein [Chitinophagaceae bacterium]